MPRFGEPADDLVDSVARADIDADRRAVEDQELRRSREPLREHDALLIAARQRRHGVFRLADLDRELADALGDGRGFLRAEISPPASRSASRIVITLLSAIDCGCTRPERDDPPRHRRCRRAMASRLLAKATASRTSGPTPESARVMPNSVCASSVRPGADQADQTDDLAGAHGQIDVRHTRRGASGRRFRRRSARRRRRGRLTAWSNRLARHQFRQPRLRHAGGVEHADQLVRRAEP